MSARSLDPLDVAIHARSLQRLARRIVHDAHAAEDAAQDAWVAALEHPPEEARSFAGWLRTVGVNLARNARRATRRRTARERAAARAEHVEPDERALERADAARLLAELLAALPEAHRTVLVLRYFEELTPTAIARQLDVPLKTVKTRHTRALAALRARLDERSGGDRATWLPALAALARPHGLGIGTAAVAGSVIVLVLGLSAAWFAASRAARGTRVPEVALSTLAESEPAGPTRAPERVASEPTPAPAAVERMARFAGVVTRAEDGSPVADVAVAVRIQNLDGRRTEETRSDALGRFALAWPVPVTLERVEVRASPTTTAAARDRYERLAPGTTRELELVVGRGATLEGVVLGPSGEPVAGATVLAWCAPRIVGPSDRSTTSDALGRFRLAHLGEDFLALAEAPGLVCEEGLRGRVASGLHGDGLEIRMAEPRMFRGTVTDERGRPIAGARLACGSGSSSSRQDETHVLGVARWTVGAMEADTGASGTFELGPYPRSSANVRVTHPDHLWEDFTVHADADNALVLRTGHVLHGRVTGANGAPVAGAAVRVDNGADAETTTDAAGLFELRPLEVAENALVLVVAEGHALLVAQPVRTGPGAPFLELRLEPARALAGRAVDPAGRPLADALVRLEGEALVAFDDVNFDERTTWEWLAGRNETRTDADGRFRFDGLHDAEFEVLVRPADAPEHCARTRTRSGREDLEIVVDRAALERLVLAGRVTDAHTGMPITAFALTVSRPDGMGHTLRVEGAEDGRFRHAGIEPGECALVLKAPGYAPWTRELRAYAEGETVLDVALVPACALQLVQGGYTPRRMTMDAMVRFEDLDGRALVVEHGDGSWTSSVAQVSTRPTSVHGLPRAPIRLFATTYGCRELVLDLDLTQPPLEPVVLAFERDPDARTARLHLGVFLTAVPELAGSPPSERMPVALARGELELPSSPVEIELLDARDARLATIVLEPAAELEDTVARPIPDLASHPPYRWTMTPGPAGQPEEDDALGPSFSGDVPVLARTALVRTRGCRPERIQLSLDPDADNVVPVVLLRTAR